MRTYLLIITLVFISAACQPPIDISSSNRGQQVGVSTPIAVEKHESEISEMDIKKSRLGEISIGMTIPQANVYLQGLTKVEASAAGFGYGGGSPSYIYSLNNEPVAALIPSLGTDTILIIVALHKGLRTANKLSPNSTVSDIIRVYPDITVMQDVMNGGEFIVDSLNNWTFVFSTDESTTIGEYPELERPSTPKRIDISADWIVIK